MKHLESYPIGFLLLRSPETPERVTWIKVFLTPVLHLLMLASQIGIDSFIVKPYEKQDLIEKIRTLVG